MFHWNGWHMYMQLVPDLLFSPCGPGTRLATTLVSSCMCIQMHRTALYWASYKGHVAIVQELLKAGADVTIKDIVSEIIVDAIITFGHSNNCGFIVWL